MERLRTRLALNLAARIWTPVAAYIFFKKIELYYGTI
eukprot:SAG31_NODE_4215_length_3457_cov_1.360036_2_plen_37_part_00